jgi:hypothetical protein
MPKLAGVNHLDAVRALEKVGFAIKAKQTYRHDGWSADCCHSSA